MTCQKLQADFSEIIHVEKTGLPIPAKDIDIWHWAKLQNAIVVTNDEDYQYLLLQKGFPPKVILLRTGNQSTNNIADILIRNKHNIEALHESEVYGMLELV